MIRELDVVKKPKWPNMEIVGKLVGSTYVLWKLGSLRLKIKFINLQVIGMVAKLFLTLFFPLVEKKSLDFFLYFN